MPWPVSLTTSSTYGPGRDVHAEVLVGVALGEIHVHRLDDELRRPGASRRARSASGSSPPAPSARSPPPRRRGSGCRLVTSVMSSPSRGRSIRSIPSTTVFRLSTSRATTRWRPKPSSWRVRCMARSAAFRISSASDRRGSSPVSSAASRKSLKPMMIIIMLLRSWATPPANRPTASIFCAWRTCCSASIRWVMSRPTPTMPATSPPGPRSGESVVCMCRVPRRDARVHS